MKAIYTVIFLVIFCAIFSNAQTQRYFVYTDTLYPGDSLATPLFMSQDRVICAVWTLDTLFNVDSSIADSKQLRFYYFWCTSNNSADSYLSAVDRTKLLLITNPDDGTDTYSLTLVRKKYIPVWNWIFQSAMGNQNTTSGQKYSFIYPCISGGVNKKVILYIVTNFPWS